MQFNHIECKSTTIELITCSITNSVYYSLQFYRIKYKKCVNWGKFDVHYLGMCSYIMLE